MYLAPKLNARFHSGFLYVYNLHHFNVQYFFNTMKIIRNALSLLLLCLLLSGCHSPDQGAVEKSSKTSRRSGQKPLSGRISISGAFALYPMVVKWAEEFKAIYPKVKVDISAGGAGKGMTDVLSGMVDIGMVSREVYPEERSKGAMPLAIVIDAVVPTTSSKNPELKSILSRGLTRQAAQKLWVQGSIKTWGELLGTSSSTPIHLFTRSDACGAAETWAHWLEVKQEDLTGVGVFGDPGAATAVQKDKVSLGYNNIAYAYDASTRRPNEGLSIVPLDINTNGTIDPDEKFYDTLDQLMDAIRNGKYPSPPARELYMVVRGKPTDPALIEFLRFVLTTGQKYTTESGFVGISPEKATQELEKIK